MHTTDTKKRAKVVGQLLTAAFGNHTGFNIKRAATWDAHAVTKWLPWLRDKDWLLAERERLADNDPAQPYYYYLLVDDDLACVFFQNTFDLPDHILTLDWLRKALKSGELDHFRIEGEDHV